MKNFPTLIKAYTKAFTAVFALSALVVLPGCMSNTQFEESELTTAGFKSVAATTAEQQAHLKELPQGKITKVQRKGKTYYVFPDLKANMIYVGQEAEYNAYQRNLQIATQRSDYIMESQNAFVSNDAYLGSFSAWGPWNGLPWGY